jgi:uncharacterized protein
MTIWAIGDLHLSFGCKDKEMNVFGENWRNHYEKIQKDWDSRVKPDDLVLIPGDISWAMHLEHAAADLDWIDARPGCKVMIKGNHDYWWHSIGKVRKVLPKSIHAIYNDAFLWNDVAIAGTRLWDSTEYDFARYIDFKPRSNQTKPAVDTKDEDKKIFERELLRLDMSLKAMNKDAKVKIVMTHYPPIGADLKPSSVSKMMEEAHIQHVLFGHLHSVHKGALPFGMKDGVHYHLTSCDYLDFTLLKVL